MGQNRSRSPAAGVRAPASGARAKTGPCASGGGMRSQPTSKPTRLQGGRPHPQSSGRWFPDSGPLGRDRKHDMSTFSLISLGRDFSTMRPHRENTMLPTQSDLAELRRRLDEIDDKLHDLLIE